EAYFVIVVEQKLVTALHEVNLYSLDAPFRELIERRLELIVERLPDHPKNDSDILLFGISREFFHVDFRYDFEQIPEFVPALVENDVLDAVPRGEIDVVLVSLRVDPGFEVDIVDVVGIPPVPGDLTWLDPGCVLELRRLLKQPDNLICQQISVLFYNSEHAPRECARAVGNGNVACALNDPQITISFQFFLQRVGGKSCGKPISAGAAQPHTRVFFHVRFPDGDLSSTSGIHNGRKSCDERWSDLRQMLRNISSFVM